MCLLLPLFTEVIPHATTGRCHAASCRKDVCDVFKPLQFQPSFNLTSSEPSSFRVYNLGVSSCFELMLSTCLAEGGVAVLKEPETCNIRIKYPALKQSHSYLTCSCVLLGHICLSFGSPERFCWCVSSTCIHIYIYASICVKPPTKARSFSPKVWGFPQRQPRACNTPCHTPKLTAKCASICASS